ncbi:MAG: hypothetical protein V4850_24680 [Myxococcota bacterium]
MVPRVPRTSAPVERAVGVVFLVGVVWLYSDALKHHRWPPGHPWSGLTLALLGLSAVLWPSPRWSEASRVSRVARVVALGLVLAASALWYAEVGTPAPSVHLGL